jgi:hypothetical protein
MPLSPERAKGVEHNFVQRVGSMRDSQQHVRVEEVSHQS